MILVGYNFGVIYITFSCTVHLTAYISLASIVPMRFYITQKVGPRRPVLC